jgi:hypothetical protein
VFFFSLFKALAIRWPSKTEDLRPKTTLLK